MKILTLTSFVASPDFIKPTKPVQSNMSKFQTAPTTSKSQTTPRSLLEQKVELEKSRDDCISEHGGYSGSGYHLMVPCHDHSKDTCYDCKIAGVTCTECYDSNCKVFEFVGYNNLIEYCNWTRDKQEQLAQIKAIEAELDKSFPPGIAGTVFEYL